MTWMTVAICFTLFLFWSGSGRADVIEGYHLLQSSAKRLIRSEGAPDVQPASGISSSQHSPSHMPRTLTWVTRIANSGEPWTHHAPHNLTELLARTSDHEPQNLTELASSVNVSQPSVSQESSNVSSAAANASASGRLYSNSLGNVSRIAGHVFISEPRNASPAVNGLNMSAQAQSNMSQYGQGTFRSHKDSCLVFCPQS